jgi:hypothetical protein
MAIGEFISSAIKNYQNADYFPALALACCAIDATARREYPTLNNKQRIRMFIQKNMRIISFFGLPGISVGGLRIKCDSIPEIDRDKNNLVGLEDIIYHAIRCNLIHECKPDSRIVFVASTRIGDFQGKFMLPYQIVWGLVLSIILSESNSSEKSGVSLFITIAGSKHRLDELWGKWQMIVPKLHYHKA